MDTSFKQVQNASCYLHVYASGKILLIPAGQNRGYIATLKHVLHELQECRSEGGILFYSLTELEENEENLTFTQAVDAIMDLGLETQMVHPHPQVFNYYKSFVPYFNDALEAAAQDVNGIITEIKMQEDLLNDLDPGQDEFNDTLLLLEELQGRYYLAKNALQRLSALHYTLCVKTEQGEA